MPTDEEIAQGLYRFEDLQALRVVENRTDLKRKQDLLNFPKAVKTGDSQAGFWRFEVHAWLRVRDALRDAPKQIAPPPRPSRLAQHDIPKKIAGPKPPKVRPETTRKSKRARGR